MVNLVTNGDFSSSNGGTDCDPTGWTVTESAAGSVYALTHTGVSWVAFNHGNQSVTGNSIQQTVTGVHVGETVTFSFNYREQGSGANVNNNASIQWEIIDGNGNIVASQNVTASGTNPSITFTATTSSYTIRFIDTSIGGGNALDPEITNVVFDVTCYVAGTMIQTDKGLRPIESLVVGDKVLTLDHGFQPLRWIGSKVVSADRQIREPKLRPIRIPAGALGRSVPERDLLVSPQHRILLVSPVAERMFGSRETLVAAVKLVGRNGIAVAEDISEVTYLHLMFDRHEVIFANGARSESLLPGPMAMGAMEPDARAEIVALFPELAKGGGDIHQQAARPIAKGRRLRSMFERHERNHLQLAG